MNINIDEVVAEDQEMKMIVEQISKALTFDLVYPIEVEGEAELFHIDLTFTMSNGDLIEYLYTSNPGSLGKQMQWIKFNTEMKIDIEEEDAIPKIRTIHKERLLKKLTFTKLRD